MGQVYHGSATTTETAPRVRDWTIGPVSNWPISMLVILMR